MEKKECLPPIKSIIQITHFSFRINKENYRKRILNELQSSSIIDELLQRPNPDHLSHILKINTHWKESVAWKSNDYDEFITEADRLTGEVKVQCIDKAGKEAVAVRIECNRSWIEEFFKIVEQTYWKKKDNIYVFDSASWDAKICFLKENGRIENESFSGTIECPYGARQIESHMAQMLKQHRIQINVSMFSGNESL